MVKLESLKNKAMNLLFQIPDFKESELPVRFQPTRIDCIPYIAIEGKNYVWLMYERGKVVERRETTDETLALFWILSSYVQHRSYDYELQNRIKYTDSRRLVFQTQSRLFSYIGEPYYSMNEQQTKKTLERAPFNDHGTLLLDLVGDFERIAHILAERKTRKYSDEFFKSVDFFIKKPYRGQYGGISNFRKSFATMLLEYTVISNELKEKGLPIGLKRHMRFLVDIRLIEEKIGEVNLDEIND